MGSFLTGVFATASVSSLDGVTQTPGGIDGSGAQVGRQFAEIGAISAYSFVVSYVLLMVLKHIPGLHLRVGDEAEIAGLDLDQFIDEQIGDWSIVHGIHAPVTEAGTSSGASTPPGEMVKGGEAKV